MKFLSKVRRASFRLFFHISKFGIKFIDPLNPRLFMVLYTKLLKASGIIFTGTPRYIGSTVKFDDFNKIRIGERVVISQNVIFLTHDYSLTTGLISLERTPRTDMAFIRNIEVGDNVFIGMNALLLPGTKIGSNVIIGAGAVIRGSIPENSIVVGNPGVVVSELKSKAEKWFENLATVDLRVD